MHRFTAKEIGLIQLYNILPIIEFINGRDWFRTYGLHDSKSPRLYPNSYIIVCSFTYKKGGHLRQDLCADTTWRV